MRSLVLVTLLAGSVLLSSPGSTAAQGEGCQFVLGFKTLHDLIPQIVGDCLVDVHYNPLNGDALQETSHGLLVWRKADNHTAFTDGYRTWVNGPFGIRERLNSQRFFWEENPEELPIVPPPVAGDRCHTAGLSLGLEGTEAGAGNVFATFRFTNNLDVSCTFFGFVGAQLLDAAFDPLSTNVVRNGGQLSNQPVPTLVTVSAGGEASFIMHWEQIPVGNETTCPTAEQLAVIPPDEFVPLIIPVHIMACGGGRLDVSAVQPVS